MIELAPAVYEHAAALIFRTPWEVSRDLQLMVQAHKAAYERYGHKLIVVGIDIYNLEVEAYGALVAQPDGFAIPAVSGHICKTLDEIIGLPPFDPATDGRCSMIIEAASELKQELSQVDVRVPVSGPFSIASNLLGFDTLLMACVLEPEKAAQAVMNLAVNQKSLIEAVRRQGLDISLFESAATPPLISPEIFAGIELPALKHLCKAATDITGQRVSCILGGDSLAVLDYLLETGCGYVICPSETDQAAFMRQMETYNDIHVRINMNPGIIAGSDAESMRAELDRVLKLAVGRENVSIGTGVLPYETPPQNIDVLKRFLSEYG